MLENGAGDANHSESAGTLNGRRQQVYEARETFSQNRLHEGPCSSAGHNKGVLSLPSTDVCGYEGEGDTSCKHMTEL